MMAFILATDFDFIAYMSKVVFFLEAFFMPMAFLEYDRYLLLQPLGHVVYLFLNQLLLHYRFFPNKKTSRQVQKHT